jgi:hypothetical protein
MEKQANNNARRILMSRKKFNFFYLFITNDYQKLPLWYRVSGSDLLDELEDGLVDLKKRRLMD